MSMAQLHVVCEGCGKTSILPLDAAGTVQECQECHGYIDVPAANYNPRTTDEDRQIQAWYDEERARRARQNEERDQQVALWHEQHLETVKLHKRNVESTERFNALINRWERMSDRMEQLLDRFDPRESR